MAGQGVHSDEWPGQVNVSRANLTKNSTTVRIKGGVKQVMSVKKESLKGPGGK